MEPLFKYRILQVIAKNVAEVRKAKLLNVVLAFFIKKVAFKG
jgi:hypothetical protein